jgi:hypothetical protein
MRDIAISGFETEDIERKWTLAVGSTQSHRPYSLTDCALYANIVSSDGEIVLRLKSVGPSPNIVITDAAAGKFTVSIPKGSIPFRPKQSLKYDLVLVVGGKTKVLWGGRVDIKAGITTVGA